jgi:tetrahydromethanopterin S-methyltransferase subunit B
MTSSESRSFTAQRYLGELDAALAAAPATVRTELVADIAGELDGLSDEEARARIAELGDLRAIAADATAQVRSMEPGAAPSKVYPTITAIVLVVGWYVVPVLGWIAGLVMIGVGAEWTSAVRRRAILTSIAAAVVAAGALLFFRTTEFGLVGLAVFLVVPLLVNIFVGASLRAHWGTQPASSR